MQITSPASTSCHVEATLPPGGRRRLIPLAVLVVLAGATTFTAGVPRPAAGEDPRPPFRLHAFAGTIVKNGGKCLDYQPEVTGSLAFLNDCSAAHGVVVDPDRRLVDRANVVLLRAGTKVIGVRRGGIILGPGPAEPLPSPSGLPLELQDEATTPERLRDQTFALDGDSIIYAADRRYVAMVNNARGRNGTDVVMGPRRLSAEEFWDMRAVDGSDRLPTAAFRRVTGFLDDPATPEVEGLLDTLPTLLCGEPGRMVCPAQPARPGEVIVIDQSLLLYPDLPPFQVIVDDLTIRSDRRGVSLGSEIAKPYNAVGSDILIEVRARNARLTGLRLAGSSRERYPTEPRNGTGILVWEDTARGTIIDHLEMSAWTSAAVKVQDTETEHACDPTDPRTWPLDTWVARNLMHDNRKYEGGYGVVVYTGGFPFVDGNTFYQNRHAIAGGKGTAHTGYRAWRNLVLSTAPQQNRRVVYEFTHDFDMHGTGSGGFGGYAGGFLEMYRNTFLGTNRPNFKIRGTPCFPPEFSHNVSMQSEDDALKSGRIGACDICRVSPEPAQFSLDDPTGRLGVGDFDGDGVEDLFLATGTAWFYSPRGNAEWRYLNDSAVRIDDLRFGDFDADGRDDVITKTGPDLLVSWGGISDWELLRAFAPDLDEIHVGDFDGIDQADIFYADGATWWIAYNSGSFQPVQTSSFRVDQLRFGDFDGDGVTDAFGVVSGAWRVSAGGTGNWSFLRSKLTDTVGGLVVADFDGNRRADVALVEAQRLNPWLTRYRWRVSRDGTTRWVGWTTNVLGPAAVGSFVDESRRAVVLAWVPRVSPSAATPTNYLLRLTFGDAGVVRHSRVDLR